MTPNQFKELLNQTMLTPGELGKAWDLYKTQSPKVAMDFVCDIEMRTSKKRLSLKLRSIPVPYKIWGKTTLKLKL